MKRYFLSCAIFAASIVSVPAVYSVEKLDRGAIAVKTDAGVFISWRSLSSDDPSTTFDIYRDGVKINGEPLTNGTNFSDADGTASSTYVVKTSVNGVEEETTPAISVEAEGFKRIHLNRPASGKTPDNNTYTYTPNDCSVGDVDGDGKYELIVKWDPSNAKDNSQSGYTGNVLIDCYRLNGEQLWRVDLGRNIRAGAHYTQFLVYDFDGDGRAEMVCRTAAGTIDGKGKPVLRNGESVNADYRYANGFINDDCNEYLTVFDGMTGAEIASVDYVPFRKVHYPLTQWGGENAAKADRPNRPDRFLATVAYLDGKTPAIVMCRGYYTKAHVAAWTFDGKNLTQLWHHASISKTAYELTDANGNTTKYVPGRATQTVGQNTLYGNGNHNISAGDVDGDGCDEIIWGAAALDSDGKLLYATGLGHGDAMHLGTLIPDREGYQVFQVHEEQNYGWDIHDAATGKIIFRGAGDKDNGRGMAADIDPDNRGYEFWSSNQRTPHSCTTSEEIGTNACSMNFRIYWDGDLYDELLDGTTITKWDGSTPQIIAALNNFSNASSINGTKSNPNLSADIIGDWREEVILYDGSNGSDLLLFTTTTPTRYRVPCLMEDHVYRLGIAWQNVAYNQPPHLGYYLPDMYANEPIIRITSSNLNQEIEEGLPITRIEGYWDKCTSVRIEGLPEGLSADIDESAARFSIEGSIGATGNYRFSITSVGGEGETVVEGTISVVAAPTLTEVAHLSFDEMNPTVTNHVYGSADVYGTPTLESGFFGNAIRFNGAGDHLRQAAYENIQMGNRDFTISLWFNSDDERGYLFHKGSNKANAATGTTGHWIGIEHNGANLYFAVDDNKVKSQAYCNSTQYFDNKWHNLVCTKSATTLSIYIDGKLCGSSSCTNTGAINDNNEPMMIAQVNADGQFLESDNRYFRGMLDDLHIYHGVMSASRIMANYVAAGVEEITINPADDINQTAVFYNLQGQRIDNPAPGAIYIMKKGTTVRKINL